MPASTRLAARSAFTTPGRFVPGFAANTLFELTLTRDSSTNLVSLYINKAFALSFTDAAGQAVFGVAGGVMHLFEEDGVTGFGEASAGYVDYVRTYDGALTGREVALLTGPGVSPVPLPAGGALLLSALRTIRST